MTRQRVARTVRLVALWLGGAALLLFTVRGSVASLHRANGSSDAPTIGDGDVFFVNRIAYDIRLPFARTPLVKRADPARGDLVLFSLPGTGLLATKRVVGIPGDVVQVTAGGLVVNGVPARYRPAGTRGASDTMIEEWNGRSHAVIPSTTTQAGDATSVPDGHVYVLGDHRDQSLDSRAFGPVPRSAVLGRVMVRNRDEGGR